MMIQFILFVSLFFVLKNLVSKFLAKQILRKIND